MGKHGKISQTYLQIVRNSSTNLLNKHFCLLKGLRITLKLGMGKPLKIMLIELLVEILFWRILTTSFFKDFYRTPFKTLLERIIVQFLKYLCVLSVPAKIDFKIIHFQRPRVVCKALKGVAASERLGITDLIDLKDTAETCCNFLRLLIICRYISYSA